MSNFQRVYHIHNRKCGGTSINLSVIQAISEEVNAYGRLAAEPGHRIAFKYGAIVGWNKKNLEEGQFVYGFSHRPIHQLSLPSRTFRFTVFRDPVNRVVSHYRMIRGYIETKTDHPALELEGAWAIDGFDKFVERLPQEHLQNQLFMFDPEFKIERALERLLDIECAKMLSNLSDVVKNINSVLPKPAEVIHARKGTLPFELSERQRLLLESKLSEEYKFLEEARKRIPL